MRTWPRSPTLLKLFVGQHIVNGLSVALAVMAAAIAACGDARSLRRGARIPTRFGGRA